MHVFAYCFPSARFSSTQKAWKALKRFRILKGVALRGRKGRQMANILIVDDQPHLQQLFSEELVDEGHRAVSAPDAESVKRYLKDSKPDLVLLDLYLNGFEGWNLLHNIKSKYPHLPVLIVTAYDSYVDDPRASQADGYMIKNFTALNGLKEKIAEVLEGKRLQTRK